jgi:hypothetical protein
MPARYRCRITKISYFSSRLERLTEMLNFTADQQAKAPILEQDRGELNVMRANPAISRKEKLDRLQSATRKSDEKMKRILSADQWQKRQDTRKQQKEQLKKIAKEE